MTMQPIAPLRPITSAICSIVARGSARKCDRSKRHVIPQRPCSFMRLTMTTESAGWNPSSTGTALNIASSVLILATSDMGVLSSEEVVGEHDGERHRARQEQEQREPVASGLETVPGQELPGPGHRL